MMMYDLPADLVEEILTRVPATSLKRVRSTCKRWNALFKDRRFTEKHFRKAPKQSRVLMLNAYRLCPMSVDLNVVPPSVEYKDALSLKDSYSKQVNIARVLHCDGLLLCITNDNKPVVWNPCLGETRWIRHEIGYDRHCKFALGYETNQSCRSYRILMFWEGYKTNKPVEGFEIYELTSNSWRFVIAPNCFRISNIDPGVTLKGNTYWIYLDSDNNDCEYLLSFDFTKERFRRLCLPSSLNCDYYMSLSVVREEQLSVLIKSIGSSEVELWVTKKIDTEVELSWSKPFAEDTRRNGLPDFMSLLLDQDKKLVAVVYTIGEDDEYYTQTWSWPYQIWREPFLFNYVPSLVQIQPKVVVSSSQAAPIVSEIFEDAPAATQNQQGNPLPLPLLDLDACLGKTTICMSEENYEDCVGVKGNQFALSDQRELFEDSFSQTRRWRTTVREMVRVTNTRGRGRGGSGRGGRGQGRGRLGRGRGRLGRGGRGQINL